MRYARFLVRLDEMDQSLRIIEQARNGSTRRDQWSSTIRKSAPPKETIALSMEALIHHFKIVSEGFRVPRATSTNPSRLRAANRILHCQTAKTVPIVSARGRPACTTCRRSKVSRPAISLRIWLS